VYEAVDGYSLLAGGNRGCRSPPWLPPHPAHSNAQYSDGNSASTNNALLSLRRRRTQKARTPNGRNANTGPWLQVVPKVGALY